MMQNSLFQYLKRRNQGAIAMEALIVIPILLLITVATVELSWMLYVRHVMVDAAEVGARYASINITATAADVDAKVMSSLQQMNPKIHAACVDSGCVTVEPNDFSVLDRGEAITVSLELTGNNVSILPNNQIFSAAGVTLNASATRAKEF